jgi:integrase
LAILEELKLISGHRELIFPGQVNPRKSMSNNTILQASAAMGYKSKMTGHGFRALAMTTLMEELSYPHDVVDRQLAHAPKNKIAAAYDRAKYLPQRQKMMQDWADYLDNAMQQPVKKLAAK